MIAFAFAVFFMIATPGPAVLALAGVGAAYSFQVGLKFLVGLTIGYLSVWVLVITGFASVIFSIPVMRTIFLFIASGYLVYLSLKIMFRGSEIAFVSPQKEPTLVEGIFLQLVNPKAYAFHSILLTGFAVFPDNFVLETISNTSSVNVPPFVSHKIIQRAPPSKAAFTHSKAKSGFALNPSK